MIAKASKSKDNNIVFMDNNFDQAHKIINQNSYKKKIQDQALQ